MKRIMLGGAIAAIAMAAAAAGYWFAMSRAMQEMATMAEAMAKPEAGKKVLYWFDPMFPQQKFDKPGKSPFMDMQLVPKYAEEGADQGTVNISPRVTQNLGVRIVEARSGALAERIEVVGSVAYNERSIFVVQARAGGFVERLHVRGPLDPVTKGAPLVDLLIPEWAAAQSEFLFLLSRDVGVNADLVNASRERLRLLGMNDADIAAIEQERRPRARITVSAPIDGVVAELGVREGMTINAGMTLFRLADLSSVWVNAEIPEQQSAALRPGARVKASVAAYPGAVFNGSVQAILPEVNAETRTLRARIEFANPDGRLKPGMFTSLALTSAPSSAMVLVPSEAVIRTGERAVVIVDEGAGRFRSVDVEIGREARGETQIRRGIKVGERVVVSGQFLIDSEASMRAAGGRLADQGAIYRGTGVLERVATDALTISHGPIPALKWGEMTMDFLPPRDGIPKDLKVGTRIEFDFVSPREGEYQITAMRALPGAAPKGAEKSSATSKPARP